MLRFNADTGLNPVRVHFSKLLSATATQAAAWGYLRQMEDLAGRMDAAFPRQFSDARKTLRENIAAMRKELGKK
ncbi:MAG: hypothetical protein KKG09_04245 [Verrucomicrobia bacterium]|nr:hypothetical protein [Verrucomicrobiota bacterium]MBU4290421.1 hypothetical protein [Verrucomicrobiota bacterium]MBU4497196.1 hypothetical protein [Verrucomicrobiota bacterium]MCG2680824.1 hypothetical protein [Kiritimatiellia bacterium]